ncbi:hypothetical protein T484DRAFT_1939736 [Baffinella frigidus]|nr:hypothetical protein T484DRAFT_1939736 [Cryptophyta sp. CCMP2293]
MGSRWKAPTSKAVADEPPLTKLQSRSCTTGMIGEAALTRAQPTDDDIKSFGGDSVRFARKMRRNMAFKEAEYLADSSDDEADTYFLRAGAREGFEAEEARLIAADAAARLLAFQGCSTRYARKLRREESVDAARHAPPPRSSDGSSDGAGDAGSWEDGPEGGDAGRRESVERRRFEAEEARLMEEEDGGARLLAFQGSSARYARKLRREESIDAARHARAGRGASGAFGRQRSGVLGTWEAFGDAEEEEEIGGLEHAAYAAEEESILQRNEVAGAVAARILKGAMRAVCGAARRGSVEEGVSLRGARRMRREASVDEAWEQDSSSPLRGAAGRASGAPFTRELSIMEVQEVVEWRKFADEEARLLAAGA